MAEIPSKIILADEFATRVDGFSIGSNDLTQLVLGVDRDSTELKSLFDERDEAVKRMIRMLITEPAAKSGAWWWRKCRVSRSCSKDDAAQLYREGGIIVRSAGYQSENADILLVATGATSSLKP